MYRYAITISRPGMCATTTTLCAIPKGASTSDDPPIGSALSPLFIDVVNIVDDNKHTKRDIARDTDKIRPRLFGGGLCCKRSTFKKDRIRC